MNPEVDVDLAEEFATEDAALERVKLELHEHGVPDKEITNVVEKLRLSGTVMIDSPEYMIQRDPEEFFHVEWKRKAA